MHHLPPGLPILVQHVADDGPGGFHVGDGKEAVVVFVLRVHDDEHAVFGGGGGGGNAEEGAERFATLCGGRHDDGVD